MPSRVACLGLVVRKSTGQWRPFPEGSQVTPLNPSRTTLVDDGDPGTVFRGLAQLVYTADDYQEMYQAICDAAVRLVDGCQHASIMLAQHGMVGTTMPVTAFPTAALLDRSDPHTDEVTIVVPVAAQIGEPVEEDRECTCVEDLRVHAVKNRPLGGQDAVAPL